MGFEFDPTNFGIGIAAGWGSAYAAYRARHRLGRIRSNLTDRAETTRSFAGGRVEGRYVNWLIEYAQQEHLLGHKVALNRLLVEPHFIPSEPFAEPPDDDVPQDPFRIVPKLHDLPFMYAPYNVPSLSIQDLSFGERAIALLGLPGSGRTTALLTIALWALGEVDFKPQVDTITAQIEAEESGLKADERAARIKDRMAIQERARERLALESGKTLEQAKNTVDPLGLSPYKRLMPTYIHLANLTLDSHEWRHETDPAEPWMRALQHHVGGTLARVMPPALYTQLTQKRALLLLDGYDELTPDHQQRVNAWLAAFVQHYPNVSLIVAASPNGYGALLHAGLTPVYLRTWADPTVKQAVTQTAEAWPQLNTQGRREAAPVPDDLRQTVLEDLRGFTPQDIVLKARAVFAGECAPEDTPTDFMAAYLRSIGITADDEPRLAQWATLCLERGSFTLDDVFHLALGRTPQAVAHEHDTPADFEAVINEDASALDDGSLDTLFGETPATPDATAPQSGKKARAKTPAPDSLEALAIETGREKKELIAIRKAQAKLVESLIAQRVLVLRRGGRYQFRHPLMLAYCAAIALRDATPEQLAAVATHPAWDNALLYAATTHDMSAAVAARAAQMPDVRYQHLTSVVRWLAYSRETPAWRGELFKQLGKLFLAPNQYPLLRERIAGALVGGRDRGALAIFERGMKHADSNVRLLSCLAVGALQEPKAVAHVAPLLRDNDSEVHLAAGMALGAIGTEEAFEEMIDILIGGTEQLRQAVAEMFAAIPDVGYPTLYEAINSEDMLLRRAAVFGLRRVNAPWALISIYRAFLEDDQWYVRSAAQQVFQDMQVDEASRLVRAYPKLESIRWLVDWVGSLGAESAALTLDDALARMVEREQGLMRAISTMAVAQLGLTQHVGRVYPVLLDEEEAVRDIAHRALAQFEAQIGHALPAPA